MQIKYFIGTDVSKETLDLCLVFNGMVIKNAKTGNSLQAIKASLPKLLKDWKVDINDVVFCMEHTGIYTQPILTWLESKKANIWLESSLHIKRSQGFVRGKNDKIDAERIAFFAFTHQHQMKFWTSPRPALIKIGQLLSLRARLVNNKKQLEVSSKELSGYIDPEIEKVVKKHTNPVMKAIEIQLQKVEKELMEVVNTDMELKRIYRLTTSVTGIGMITALNIMVKTNEFKTIQDAKKFACYCGVVPFEHSSGTSINKKPKVSKMANKDLKTLLHLAATSAIQSQGEIREYYLRKVDEGKSKMSVINAIRNKLVLRVFSCVKQNRPYQKNYQPAIA